MRDRAVLVCVDGSAGATEAIGVAGELFPGRKAIVLNVVESLTPAVFYGAAGDVTRPPEDEVPLHVPSAEAGRRLVEEAVRVAERSGLDASPLVDVTPGRTSRRIVEIADEYDAAAIVVGARGRSALASIVLGSVSHEVVQYAHCPVLVVHGSRAASESE